MASCADLDESGFTTEVTVSGFVIHDALPDLMMETDPKTAKLWFPFDGSAGKSSVG
jgi:hypothetical protein